MRARVPASTSNLGPGFDVLGLALGCYLSVSVEAGDGLSIESAGEGADLPRDASHLACRIATAVAGTSDLAIRVDSDIPLGRGLGSSAALALAAAAAAGAPDPLALAAAADGHAENAAASMLGGLVAATFVDGAVVARRLPLDERLVFVALVPDRQLATKTARQVLPTTVEFGDATFNLGRLGLLLAGLADADALVAAAGEDRLHQPARSGLYPEADGLMRALREGGAVVSCWSGAGPTILGICTDRAAATSARDAGESALIGLGLGGWATVLDPDRNGLVLEP